MHVNFPVVFHAFGLNLPAHLVFETIAYGVGFRLYLWLRKKNQDTISDETRLTVLVGAVVGAAVTSKVLGFAEHPELWPLAARNPAYLLAAKTILGGLLGGIIGVETVKAFAGVKRSTGDIYVFPLLLAIMIGRIGCLLTGVSDGTWGKPTTFFMGFDAGDGVIRHPTPLYEIMFLGVLGIALLILRKWASPECDLSRSGKGDFPPALMRGGLAALEPLKEGDLFKLFIMAYCGWRFCIEFLKPVATYGPGLSILQIAALGGFVFYAAWFVRRTLGENDGHA